MIYVTGDCHGDFTRFSVKNFPEQKNMTENDYVIVTGDLGIVWDGSAEEKWWTDWLSEKPFTLLFCDGNHENFDMLGNLPEEEWHGGMTHIAAPGIRHLMRGQVFDIDDRTFFVFGGGKSHDIKDGILDPADPRYREKRRALRLSGAMYRIRGVSWWEQEMPSAEEYETGIANLDKACWSADFIITHSAPSSLLTMMDFSFRPDPLTAYLEDIHEKCRYGHWFFGHYHMDMAVTPKDICLYEQIVRIA